MSKERSRNEVFDADRSARSVLPQQNVVKEDFNWEIPIEAVPIPSEGKVYPPDSVLYGQSLIEIKAMTAKEEDILTSRALIKKGTVISHLLASCIVNKNVNVKDMLIGDRNALMIAVRITGYGSDYNADVECPSCSTRSRQTFELADLTIKRLEIDPVVPGENRFSFTLPVTKQAVNFKFLTGRDEEELTVISERKKKIFSGKETDSLVTSRLTRAIVSVGDIDDQNKINMFVERMPALDSRKLRSYIDANEPGIDMNVWMDCPNCSTSSEVGLPMGADFFWPRD